MEDSSWEICITSYIYFEILNYSYQSKLAETRDLTQSYTIWDQYFNIKFIQQDVKEEHGSLGAVFLRLAFYQCSSSPSTEALQHKG